MAGNQTGVASQDRETCHTVKRYLGPNAMVMSLLVLLSVVGIGITDFAPQFSHWFWLAMVPATGTACLVMEWSRARQNGLDATTSVKKRCRYGSASSSRSTWYISFCTPDVLTARTPGWSSSSYWPWPPSWPDCAWAGGCACRVSSWRAPWFWPPIWKNSSGSRCWWSWQPRWFYMLSRDAKPLPLEAGDRLTGSPAC